MQGMEWEQRERRRDFPEVWRRRDGKEGRDEGQRCVGENEGTKERERERAGGRDENETRETRTNLPKEVWNQQR